MLFMAKHWIPPSIALFSRVNNINSHLMSYHCSIHDWHTNVRKVMWINLNHFFKKRHLQLFSLFAFDFLLLFLRRFSNNVKAIHCRFMLWRTKLDYVSISQWWPNTVNWIKHCDIKLEQNMLLLAAFRSVKWRTSGSSTPTVSLSWR